MSCITVRGCPIGTGRPKVILPIVEESEAAILAQGTCSISSSSPPGRRCPA